MNKPEQNVHTIQAEIEPAQLIAVSKYVDAQSIKALYQQGQRLFGENRPKDLIKKQDELADSCPAIEWHFIGRLQRRPVKDVINRIDYLHSLDRMSLVREVDKRANHPIKCFLQVNVSEEDQKAGFFVDELDQVIKEIASYPNIYIVGLMTMAPYEADREELNQIFFKLSQLQKEIESLHLDYAPCHELSMGMSRDYPIAVDHGATYVRIGRAIFQNE